MLVHRADRRLRLPDGALHRLVQRQRRTSSTSSSTPARRARTRRSYCLHDVLQRAWCRRSSGSKSARRTSWMLWVGVASLINVGMWFERFIIIVTSLHQDFMPSSWAHVLRRPGSTSRSWPARFVLLRPALPALPQVPAGGGGERGEGAAPRAARGTKRGVSLHTPGRRHCTRGELEATGHETIRPRRVRPAGSLRRRGAQAARGRRRRPRRLLALPAARHRRRARPSAQQGRRSWRSPAASSGALGGYVAAVVDERGRLPHQRRATARQHGFWTNIPITFESRRADLACSPSSSARSSTSSACPRTYHPVFESERFRTASLDAFWISAETTTRTRSPSWRASSASWRAQGPHRGGERMRRSSSSRSPRAACGDTTIVDPMERQPKFKAFAANPLTRTAAPCASRRREPSRASGRRCGRRSPPAAIATARSSRPSPSPVTRELHVQGRKRFEIHCAICHGLVGDGV